MKSLMKNLALLSMGLMTYSCNEKISPELANGSSTTVGGPTPPGTVYSFEVTNETAPLLNYVIHPTGPSTAVNCKIEDENFSTTLFKSTPATYDISCFVEAEEQALYFNGLDLKIKATAGLCENVVYAPYHFFQYQPGSSTRTIDVYKCSDVTSAQAALSAIPPWDGAGCDQYVQATLVVGISIPKDLPESNEEFCDFDYSQIDEDAPNCDTGIVTINEYTYAETAAASCSDSAITSQAACLLALETWTPAVIGRTLAISSVKCGGEIDNCRAGAGLTAISKNYSGIKAINYTTQGAKVEQKVTLASPHSNGYFTNLSVANFVRQCSGPVDNTTLANFEPTTGDIADELNKRLFDPAVLERYAAGRRYWQGLSNADGAFDNKYLYTALNKLAPVLTVNHYVDTTLGRTRTFYAADSFMGTGAAASSAAPNYTFYCLNDSLDIKARIRIIVREWDRLPAYTTQDFTLLSDAFYQLSLTPDDARMDTTGTELDEDDNPFNNFNDIRDWDDFVSMNDRCSAPVAGTWYGSGLFIGSGL